MKNQKHKVFYAVRNNNNNTVCISDKKPKGNMVNYLKKEKEWFFLLNGFLNQHTSIFLNN